MGCAQSQEDGRDKRRNAKKKDKETTGKSKKEAQSPSQQNDLDPVAPGTTVNPLKGDSASNKLLGKDKYFGEIGAVVMSIEAGTLVVHVPSSDDVLLFAFRDNQGVIFVKEFITDAQLEAERSSAGLADLGWGSFFKSIASDIMKSKAKVTTAGAAVTVAVTMVSSKDAKFAKPWSVRLTTIGSNPRDVFRCFIAPMSRMVQKRRIATGEAAIKELDFIRFETQSSVANSSAVILRKRAHALREGLTKPRVDAAEILRNRYVTDLAIAQLQRKIARAKGEFRGGALDKLYDEGGPRFFLHLDHSPDHHPVEKPIQPTIVAAIKGAFPLQPSEHLVTKLNSVPTSPTLAKLMQAHPNDRPLVEGVMKALQKIDQWDYNVFDMEKSTQSNALVFTAYAILLKLDLVAQFDINESRLHAFLTALQAGYHPNPYHNATHAADVTHINYYIMTQGGLVDKCKLSKEELLAGVLAGAIHDYDHPGFNNNFHTRTNAYLSTLYNDRSILENHHCACVYEMLRMPKYNIFAHFTEEQKREVRDTMLEMVLSTDMGNHGRIFQQFRRRLSDRPDWAATKDDIRLALAISIKMADISNCGRPSKLYLEWAKNIASEFYIQGDAEAKLCLSISPFMDRSKDKQEFPKGQISFMNFIVIPMFEAITEFLPPMEFCLKHCTENKEYWQALDA